MPVTMEISLTCKFCGGCITRANTGTSKRLYVSWDWTLWSIASVHLDSARCSAYFGSAAFVSKSSEYKTEMAGVPRKSAHPLAH
jgi:hypothetical protein